MKNSKFLIIVVIIIILVALIMRLTGKGRIVVPTVVIPTASSTDIIVTAPVASSTDVIISKPTANSLVTSPLTVEGQARGSWFFEATLLLRLEDETGRVIASAPGRAQSAWTTDQLVEFTGTLDFVTTSTSGFLVVAKDNPSGLPQYDSSIKIPINFK